jgi:ribonuclease D
MLKGPRLPRAERAVRQARHKALTTWRKRMAEERKVDPQVVLPGHCLQALVVDPPANGADLLRVEGFGAARVERYGKELVALLQG